MGSPLGPSLAYIFMCTLEHKFLDNCPSEFKPSFYRRYVDATLRIFRIYVILLRNRIREENIVQYHVGQTFFAKLTQDWKLSQCFAGVVGRSLPFEGGLPKDIEFI